MADHNDHVGLVVGQRGRPRQPAAASGRDFRPEELRAGPGRPGRSAPIFGKISAKCCSFSAVSAPIFTRKYAFCSIFRNLPDFQADIFEIWQYFANFATFAIFLLNLYKKFKLLNFQTEFLLKF